MIRAVREEQHDNHCWLTFHGFDRKITGMSGVAWIETCSVRGARAVLDLSHVRWDEYHEAWLAMQDEAFPGWR